MENTWLLGEALVVEGVLAVKGLEEEIEVDCGRKTAATTGMQGAGLIFE